jgi:lipoate-protein ligase A
VRGQTLRLLDAGVATAAENMALDAALLTARSRGGAPPTIRFLQFSPPAVLLGVYQRLEEEVRLDYCRGAGIDINRRLTGGGTIYFDEPQLGWEIVASPADLGGAQPLALFERLCRPVIAALRSMGLDAAFRPRNDIEIGGRKISGTGGTSEGDAFLFQGTLLTDFDVDGMLRALRVPVEKLKRKEIDSLKDRVTCLAWELGSSPPLADLKAAIAREFERAFGAALSPGALTDLERELLKTERPRRGSDAWIRGDRLPASIKHYLRGYSRLPSGTLKASVVYDEARDVLESVVFSGDFFAFPGRALYDLEAALKGAPAAEVHARVSAFLDESGAVVPGIGADRFVSAVEDAMARTGYVRRGIAPEDANALFSIVGGFDEVARRGATVVLLPYCAKPIDCDLRHQDACTACGRCEIGEVYELAREMGLEVRTILSFEHLMETLGEMARRGVRAFVGSCCEAFYLKHREDMERRGVPGVLVDVGSQTCYDLGRTREAYRGAFEGETKLRPALLTSVIRACAGNGERPR